MTDKEKLSRRKREPSEVRIMQLDRDEPVWEDVGNEFFLSTHDAEVALRKIAKPGETYRIVTVHREVTASIEQREPKIKLLS